MIRPEIKSALWRWREVVAGTALLALAFYWILGPGGLLGGIGWVIAIASAAVIVTGYQRARFRRAGDGPGVVQIIEGQISYFGPLTGGHMALSELSRLTLDGGASPAHWLLHQPGQPDLAIPVNARGSDALFDAFTALPGLSAQGLLAAQSEAFPGHRIVWSRTPVDTMAQRLH